MRARGGAQDGSQGGSSSSSSSPISAGWVAVEGGADPGGNMKTLPEVKEEDVPDTVDYNGEVRCGRCCSSSRRAGLGCLLERPVFLTTAVLLYFSFVLSHTAVPT